MKILVVGAGAIGGYFGGRLLEAGRDVTFLVRRERRERLAATGLVIRSGSGDYVHANPPTVLGEELSRPFDLVLVSCKAYDLEGAIQAFAPAVGPDTVILPLQNGMRHLDWLDQRFGAGRVLGGLVLISSGLDPEGRILHYNNFHGIVFGERDGTASARAEAVAAALGGATFDARRSDGILLEMWEKWVFIASLASINCLMRGTVADYLAAGGEGPALALVDECAAVAARQGFPPREAALAKTRAALTTPSGLIASMLRDLERQAPIEADHVIGDLLRRGEPGASPLLTLVLAHLKTYEARRGTA